MTWISFVLFALAGLFLGLFLSGDADSVLGLNSPSCGGLAVEHPFDGWSMFPVLRPGDSVLVERRAPVLGDVVVFENLDGVLVAHRVVEDLNGWLRTKGDNNAVPDPDLVSRDAVEGVVCGVVRE